MFARDKRIGPYTYVYLVENVREEGRTKQRIIANLGRKEVVVARGDLDPLARSVVRLAQRSMVLSLVEGEVPPNARCQRIGPALLFERLWHEVWCPAGGSSSPHPASFRGPPPAVLGGGGGGGVWVGAALRKLPARTSIR